MQEISLSGTAFTDLLKAVLDKKASFRFQAKGFSMSPFIKDSDIITVSPLNNVPLCVGDIVAFTDKEAHKLIVHRIINERIEKDTSYFLIKGDNAPRCAFEISPRENILGRVTNIERHGKKVFIGLGPERRLIVLLNRIGLLRILFLPWRFVNKRLDRKS